MTLTTSIVRLRHHIRVVHASTGAPIGRLSVASGQHARVVADGVVVAAHPDIVLKPQLVITVTDDVLAGLLVLRPGRTVLVDLDATRIEVAVRPVPMTLTVELVTPITGAPSTGRTVTAGVALPETEPGVYRSEPVEWTAALTPAELLVDGNPLRTVHLDLRRASTRVRLIDTT